MGRPWYITTPEERITLARLQAESESASCLYIEKLKLYPGRKRSDWTKPTPPVLDAKGKPIRGHGSTDGTAHYHADEMNGEIPWR